MNVGLAGSGALATFVSRRLENQYALRVFDTSGGDTFRTAGIENADSIAALAECSDVLLVCTESDEQLNEMLSDGGALGTSLREGQIVANLAQSDPDRSRDVAVELGKRGVVLVDAPLHTENTAAINEASAILFGGPQTALESLRALLESICSTVIHCGGAGDGHAMRLVVASVAACNRQITYECAAMGVSNGLTIEDMATVLNKSSGYNSASARVLPALASNEHTADVTLGDVASDLTMASALGMRYGAPMLIATLVRSMLDAACNRLDRSCSVDELAAIWVAEANLPVPTRS